MNLTKLQLSTQPRLLVVEDEKNLRELLSQSLRREGYRVITAAYGSEAVHLATTEQPDLIVLDLVLPDMTGFEVCRAVRGQRLTMPIVMLSGRNEELDKVLALELGADDYLTKPYSFRELLARIHAQLRRVRMILLTRPEKPVEEEEKFPESNQPISFSAGSAEPPKLPLLVAGDITIDLSRRAVTCADRTIAMTPKEFDLLAFLARYPMQVFSRQELLNRVWGGDFAGSTRTVDVHIRWLRAKLEPDATNPQVIQTVYSIGYKFNSNVVAKASA